jgi:hypothetical protein
VEQPLLELTVPHTLLIIERASRDLRAARYAEQIPVQPSLDRRRSAPRLALEGVPPNGC